MGSSEVVWQKGVDPVSGKIGSFSCQTVLFAWCRRLCLILVRLRRACLARRGFVSKGKASTAREESQHKVGWVMLSRPLRCNAVEQRR